MKKDLLKIIGSFNYTISKKKMLFVLLTILLFFIYNDRIVNVIDSYFLINNEFSNFFIDSLIIIASLLLSYYFLYKIWKHNYLPSFTEIYFSVFIFFVLLFFSFNALELKWHFLSDSLLGIHYIYFIIIPLFFFISSLFIKFLKKHLITPFKEPTHPRNQYLSDDPIYNFDEDKLGYKPIVEKLSKILLSEYHKKSISVGLVGPWGNGKSSVLNLIKKKIESKDSLEGIYNLEKEFIIINFLPYLNHKEEDIIHEFFVLLSNKISNYNGKLSNQIAEYSQKITDIYNDKSLTNILKKHITNYTDSPAKDLYDDINERLKEIDKKIIVFIDDLDRINDIEILQILKLIRNTADFRNTIFLVAMDKEYVISRLKSNNQILDTNFIDKFFQLEVYLPEIDKRILREYFQASLKNSSFMENSKFEKILSDSINDTKNLFDDYVKNFRDVKRLINQITFDYPFINNEIDFTDFTNFTLFKLKFPQFVKVLKDKRNIILDLDQNTQSFKLKTKKTKQTKETSRTLFFRFNPNDMKYLEKYELYDSFSNIEDCFKNSNTINCEDEVLLIKSLAYLFGDQNPLAGSNSIKFENNFRMLMQQKIFENVLIENEFENLIDLSDSEAVEQNIFNLNNQGKINQLLDRLEYYSEEDKDRNEHIILILLYLYNSLNEFQIFENQILKLSEKFIDIKFKLFKDEIEDAKKWIIENIFEGNLLSSFNKIMFLSSLIKIRYLEDLWSFPKKDIIGFLYKFFTKHLEEKKELSVNDYSIFHAFHSLKTIEELNKVMIKDIQNYWINGDHEILCAQLLGFNSFSFTSFNVVDTTTEIFGSKDNLIDFLKVYGNPDSLALNEFLDFLKLCSITNHSQYVKYKFENSPLIIKRINEYKENHKRQLGKDDYSDITQVVIETNEFDAEIYKSNKLYETARYSIYQKNGLYYIFINLNNSDSKSHLLRFTDKIYEVVKSQENWKNSKYLVENVFKNESFLYSEQNDYYFKVISIQFPFKA